MSFPALFVVINVAIVLCFANETSFGNVKKCCSPNSTYISAGHYCQQEKKINRPFIQEKIPQINLPSCKVILDEEFKSTTDNLTNNYYCVDKNEKDSETVRKCYDSLDICKEKRCIKKCCLQGQSFVNSTKCYKTSVDYGLDLSQLTAVVGNYKEPFAIIYNSTCENVRELDYKMHDFLVDDQGRFNVTINGYLSNTWSDNINETESYCIEHFKDDTTNGFFFYICMEKLEFSYERLLYPLMLSCIFSSLTIVIYVLLGETKKVFGKILVCYCLAVLGWFGGIAAYIFTDTFMSDTACKILAYSNVFTRSSNFTWLSVLCWDLWRTLGSTKGRIDDKNADSKKLAFYSLYAWGIPALMMLNLLFFCTYNTILPDVLQPVLQKGKCLFAIRPDYYGEVVFNMVPNIIIQICSIFFFVMTITHCIKIKNEINKINDTTKDDKVKKFQKDKERILLLVKLMVIMGVIFIYEAASAFFSENVLNSEYIIYLENFFNWINALQGLWIFIIFVCKKQILGKCLKQFKHLTDISNSVSSNTTNLSSLSSLSNSQSKDVVPLKEYTPNSKQQN